jgi:hypothetical protein
VKNRQRSTLFQIASAAALTSSSLATSLSATGAIAPWCWWLWLLMAMQATAGILVVHARLDARIASRRTAPANERFRRAAQVSLGALTPGSAPISGCNEIGRGLVLLVGLPRQSSREKCLRRTHTLPASSGRFDAAAWMAARGAISFAGVRRWAAARRGRARRPRPL